MEGITEQSYSSHLRDGHKSVHLTTSLSYIHFYVWLSVFYFSIKRYKKDSECGQVPQQHATKDIFNHKYLWIGKFKQITPLSGTKTMSKINRKQTGKK